MADERNRMDAIEIKLAGLEAVIKLHGQKIEALFGLAALNKEMIYGEADYLRRTITKVDKAMDLYYNIYPDRLEGDLKDIREYDAAQAAVATARKAELDAKTSESAKKSE
jgi:hypothetical protein